MICDYCGSTDANMTNRNRFICDDCLEDADPNIRLVDPDYELDAYKDRQMGL